MLFLPLIQARELTNSISGKMPEHEFPLHFIFSFFRIDPLVCQYNDKWDLLYRYIFIYLFIFKNKQCFLLNECVIGALQSKYYKRHEERTTQLMMYLVDTQRKRLERKSMAFATVIYTAVESIKIASNSQQFWTTKGN